ncbi:TPA: hypothetical protein RF372_000445 [Listeria monocytogenes]|uniref:Lin1301 protein n=1 Tax=Listeria innocua serovar 6a (strain ATCC BAA-680 / CLIP 11262) TaxID=272626 RepID=Q92C90_LISIN|nr:MULTISPECIES: hypothetical protein [Listeria]EAE5606634.1 hypothetical protein [Listeria monocytogenes]EAE9977136.1 hypothetical protein [Listeria monocytogenes]EAE9987764.1 hypothetical protein [Listeria monocytogenes]EAE9989450.1 hypothetical protein [Listeria monocytogenes]EAE9991953.1 hypothetical protein [Listeria monocytogenes]
MKKKWLIILLVVIVICASLFGIKWLVDRNNIVGMIQVDGLVYVMTNEPANKDDALEKIGEIKNKIKRYKTPDKDFTSNKLAEGSELYKAKNGEDLPRTILYKDDGKYYVASEAAEQPNQKQ